MSFKKYLLAVFVLAMLSARLCAMEVEDPRIMAIYDVHRKCFYPCVVLIHFNKNFELPDKICKNIAALIASRLSDDTFNDLEFYFNNATQLSIYDLPVEDVFMIPYAKESPCTIEEALKIMAKTLRPRDPESNDAYLVAEARLRNNYFTHYFFIATENLLQFFSLDVSIQIIINSLSKANIKLENILLCKGRINPTAYNTQKDLLHAEIMFHLACKLQIICNLYEPDKNRNGVLINANFNRDNEKITIITFLNKELPESLNRLGNLDLNTQEALFGKPKHRWFGNCTIQ